MHSKARAARWPPVWPPVWQQQAIRACRAYKHQHQQHAQDGQQAAAQQHSEPEQGKA